MKFTARKLVVICAIQICLMGSLRSQEFAKPLETYQIESQYGPEIAVLNPIFPKDGKLELNLGVNYSPVSSLYNFYGASAGLTYHFNRRHAIEPIWAQYNFGELFFFCRRRNQKQTQLDTERGARSRHASFNCVVELYFHTFLFQNASHRHVRYAHGYLYSIRSCGRANRAVSFKWKHG